MLHGVQCTPSSNVGGYIELWHGFQAALHSNCNILLIPAKPASPPSCRWGKHQQLYISQHLWCFHPLTPCSRDVNYTLLCSENMKCKLYMHPRLNVSSIMQRRCWRLYWTVTWAPSAAAFKCNILPNLHHLLLLLLHCSALSRIDWCTLERAEKPRQG